LTTPGWCLWRRPGRTGDYTLSSDGRPVVGGTNVPGSARAGYKNTQPRDALGVNESSARLGRADRWGRAPRISPLLGGQQRCWQTQQRGDVASETPLSAVQNKAYFAAGAIELGSKTPGECRW